MLYKEEKFDRSYIDDHLTLDMHVANLQRKIGAKVPRKKTIGRWGLPY